MFWTVLEVQEDVSGIRGCLPTIYNDEDAALAKFFTVCAAAAQSALPYHACHILRSDGIIVRGEVFERR